MTIAGEFSEFDLPCQVDWDSSLCNSADCARFLCFFFLFGRVRVTIAGQFSRDCCFSARLSVTFTLPSRTKIMAIVKCCVLPFQITITRFSYDWLQSSQKLEVRENLKFLAKMEGRESSTRLVTILANIGGKRKSYLLAKMEEQTSRQTDVQILANTGGKRKS